MPAARQKKPEPISEARFQAAIQRLLSTPPRPNGEKKPRWATKTIAKPKKG